MAGGITSGATDSCGTTGAASGSDYKTADESVAGVDINGDGDLLDVVKVVAIDWMATANGKSFSLDFIGSQPNHSSDTVTITTGVTIDA